MENTTIGIIPNMEPMDLILGIITAIGVFFGPWFASRYLEKWKIIREHFDDIKKKIVEPWESELDKNYEFRFIISVDLKPRIGYVEKYPGVRGHFLFLLEEVERIFKKEEGLFKCARETHSNTKGIIHTWGEFGEKLKGYEHECALFFDEIGKDVCRRAQLPLLNKVDDNRYIKVIFIEHLYNKLIPEIAGVKSRYCDIQLMARKNPNGSYELYYKESDLKERLYAKGTEEDIEKCKTIFKEMPEEKSYREKAEGIIELANKIDTEKKNIKWELKRIIDSKGTLKGKCDYLK